MNFWPITQSYAEGLENFSLWVVTGRGGTLKDGNKTTQL